MTLKAELLFEAIKQGPEEAVAVARRVKPDAGDILSLTDLLIANGFPKWRLVEITDDVLRRNGVDPDGPFYDA